MPGPGSGGAAPQSSDLHEAASSEVKQPSGQSQKKQRLRSRLLSFFVFIFFFSALLANTPSLFRTLRQVQKSEIATASHREGGRKEERATEKNKNDILKPYAYLTKKGGGETQNLHISLATSFADACFTIPKRPATSGRWKRLRHG